jgi:hypothetical protein
MLQYLIELSLLPGLTERYIHIHTILIPILAAFVFIIYSSMSRAGASRPSTADRRPADRPLAMPDPVLQTEELSPWPALPFSGGFDVRNGRKERWLDYGAPIELRFITIGASTEVMQIVHDSLAKGQYRAGTIHGDDSGRDARENSRTHDSGREGRSVDEVSPVSAPDDVSFSSRSLKLSAGSFARLIRKGIKTSKASHGLYRGSSGDKEIRKSNQVQKATG